MEINPGWVVGVGIALVLIAVARWVDRRRHRDRLERIQERIRRRQAGVDRERK